MTQKEMTEIFSMFLLAWPNAEIFKGGAAKLKPTVELWTKALPDVDAWTGQQAALLLCRESRFPPTIAEFLEKANAIQTELDKKADEAWKLLLMEEAFGVEELSPPLQQAVEYAGGSKRLEAADGYRLFCAAYQQMLRMELRPELTPKLTEGRKGP